MPENPTNGHNELLTAEEVGRILKMKPERVLEAARSGKLPRFKHGKMVRFRPTDVEAFIQQQMAKR